MKTNKQIVCAIIVTHFPEKNLIENIGAIFSQVDQCIIVDNASSAEIIDQIIRPLESEKVKIIYNPINLGLATAFNQGVHLVEDDCDWVITFDQDSKPNSDLIQNLLSFYEGAYFKDEIGLLAPTHFDQKTGYRGRVYENLKADFMFQDYVFSSGSLIPTFIFKKIGYFKDELFVDYIDHDFCLRLRNRGYRTVVVAKAHMAHNLGNIRIHNLGPKTFFSHNYSPRRRYYMARNRVAIYREHFSIKNLWIFHDIWFGIKDFIKLIFVEKNRVEKLKAICAGTLDGFSSRMGSYDELYPVYANPAEHNLTLEQILKNSSLNLVGQVIPLLIGILTIPRLLHDLGNNRFSILTIIWMALGYFTFFDLGLGRAIIKLVADKIGEGNRKEIPSIFWSSTFIMLIVSLLGSILVLQLGPYIVSSFVDLASDIRKEVLDSLVYLAAAIPIVTMTAGVRGVLEAEHDFKTLNYFQIALGVFTYASPLIILSYSHRLDHIVFILLLGRLLSLIFMTYCAFNKHPELRKISFVERKNLPRLLTFGSWLTVSNIISPVMVYFDRFFLSFMVPIKLVAFYTTPYEAVSRLLIIPSSLVRVLFPAFATTGTLNAKKLMSTYLKSLVFTAFIMIFPCAFLFFFSFDLLKIWLGSEFSENSYLVLEVLSIGIYFNSLAFIPHTLIQSTDRPDLTAKIHLFELPFYLILIYYLIGQFGILGAAIAWTIRVFVDMVLMLYFTKKVIHPATKFNHHKGSKILTRATPS